MSRVEVEFSDDVPKSYGFIEFEWTDSDGFLRGQVSASGAVRLCMNVCPETNFDNKSLVA